MDQLLANLGIDPASIAEIEKTFPFRVSPFIKQRVADGTYPPEALRQFLPRPEEKLLNTRGYVPDPNDESSRHPVRWLTQSYDNRIIVPKL